MGVHASLRSQQGSALIFAVGLCTLVVILATSLLLGLHHDMRRFERLDSTVSQLATAQSVTVWAMSVLSDDTITNKVEKTFEDELNGLEVHASLIDIDGLFNVNTLMDEKSDSEYSPSSVFERLTQALNTSEEMASVMESRSTAIGLVSDLKTVIPLPQKMYIALLPYIRANETSDRAMNVNTMPNLLMGALLMIEESDAQALSQLGPYESEFEFNQALSQLAIQIPAAGLSDWLKYDSAQYLVQMDIYPKGEKGLTQMYTLLTRTKEGWRVVYSSTGVRI